MKQLALILLLIINILLAHGAFSNCFSALPAPPPVSDPTTIIKNRLAKYFTDYRYPAITSNTPINLNNVEVDSANRVVTLYANAGFAEQPFTRETVRHIYRDIANLMPPPFSSYQTRVFANGMPIDELIPMAWSDSTYENRRWGEIAYRGNPWVTPISRPYDITHGLQGHHLALWASHGSYYDFNKGLWKWQRPRLYCTTEDIFTQSFVVPFLIPMLENAGAVVFTPRERDWQCNEVIVDNDISSADGIYTETNGTYEWETAGKGFSKLQDIYFDGENPFSSGTSRKAEAQPRKRQASQIVWQPRLPEAGLYAVYVSYQSLPTSVSDAEYEVRHRGVATKFRVNQQMGGGTWVYLGTFDFAAGSSKDNCVTLTNQSSYRGVVTADAVRFGGGMGNIARGDSMHAFVRSNLPRYLEGSRYYAQWAGMPYSLYRNKEDNNDYAEDINTRSLMTNHLARGSVFLPGDSGLNVPIELSFAVHSDAGFRPDKSHIGTLGIYTTGINTPGEYEGMLAEGLLPSNRSRLMSRDLCDIVMTQVDNDIRKLCGNWNRRQMYDRNYSETRLPEVPAMILETMSHQNFADLVRGHDPVFKMLFSRSIYKGILNYMCAVHNKEGLITQPLPVKAFSATLTMSGDSVQLSWQPTADVCDESATPTGYVVYTSEGERGFDNGTRFYTNHVSLPVRRNTLTRYLVRAFNEGGCSLPSEELCVYSPNIERHRLLIVNGFTRLAGPQPVDDETKRGFDFRIDPGVVYQHSSSYCGIQHNMLIGNGEYFGQSGDEFEGMLIAGNTFDYPTLHSRDFLLSDTTLSISTCSSSALEQGRVPGSYHAIDLILGAQRADGYSINSNPAIPLPLRQALSSFCHAGGSLLVSGAYISEECDPEFAKQTLHLVPDGALIIEDSTNQVVGMSTRFSIYDQPNEESYTVRRLSILLPQGDSFTSAVTAQSIGAQANVALPQQMSLAVAYPGNSYRVLTYGFPLECIRERQTRQTIMAASLSFILKQN